MTGQEKARGYSEDREGTRDRVIATIHATLSSLNFTLSKIGNISVLLTN